MQPAVKFYSDLGGVYLAINPATFRQANQDGKPNEMGNQDEVMSKSRDDVLFPLDGARGFTGDVEGYSVHVSDLVGDSVGDFCNQVIRQPGPVSCHGVFT